MKFVIVSPKQKSGGAIVLHALYKYLNALGYDAKIFYTEVYGKGHLWVLSELKFLFKWIKYTVKDYFIEKKFDYHKPVKNIKRKLLPFVMNSTIVIYPDTIYGNPLYAKNIVRWFLYYDRYGNKPKAYGKGDVFFCYRQQFNNWQLNPEGKSLKTPFFDLCLYKRTNYGNRNGKCYVIRKGVNRSDLPNDFDGVIVDDLPEEEKVKVFNDCEICISYDTQTAYSGIAAMCGCLSIIVPEQGKKREDYLSGDDCAYGVAYGFAEEEIKYAQETAHLVKQRYENVNADGIENVKKFVKICKECFSE